MIKLRAHREGESMGDSLVGDGTGRSNHQRSESQRLIFPFTCRMNLFLDAAVTLAVHTQMFLCRAVVKDPRCRFCFSNPPVISLFPYERRREYPARLTL